MSAPKLVIVNVNTAGFTAIVAHARHESWAFCADPLPFDNWRITTKDEGSRRLVMEQFAGFPDYKPVEEV